MPKAKFQSRSSSGSRPDLRVTRLSVTLARDEDWIRVDEDQIAHALLYIGIPPAEVLDKLHLIDHRNPFHLVRLLDYLHRSDYLAGFLTELLRTGFSPNNAEGFHSHLQPLGFDWDEDAGRVRPATTHPQAEKQIRTELETSLAKVSEKFPNMLNGAWEAYYSDNPDKYRQTISSCRELLNQVTKKLSDGEALERKERVKRILGSEHRTKLVESAANFVDAIYDAQSAQEHTSPDQATALFVLVETEHVLHFLLKASRNGHKSDE